MTMTQTDLRIPDPSPEQYKKVLSEFEKTYYFNKGRDAGISQVINYLYRLEAEACGGAGLKDTEYGRIAGILFDKFSFVGEHRK